MWLLTRNLTPGEVRTCKLSRKQIIYGDYYYQNSDDPNEYVLASEYRRYEWNERERSFDYSKLEQAQNEREYTFYMIQAQQEFLANTILREKIVKNGCIQEMGINGLPTDDK